MKQHQPLRNLDVLSAIGIAAKGNKIKRLKVAKKHNLIARGFGFGNKVCILLNITGKDAVRQRIVDYRVFDNKQKEEVNDYVSSFLSSGQTAEGG